MNGDEPLLLNGPRELPGLAGEGSSQLCSIYIFPAQVVKAKA
jgi:hypothetical protein